MVEQIHKRLSVEFVEELLEAFNGQRITERTVCELFGIKRTKLYELRKKWLRCQRREGGFLLWDCPKSDFHKFPEEIEDWLHRELQYIRSGAGVYRGRFNFAFLGEMAQKEFGREFDRNVFIKEVCLRAWLLSCPSKRKREGLHSV